MLYTISKEKATIFILQIHCPIGQVKSFVVKKSGTCKVSVADMVTKICSHYRSRSDCIKAAVSLSFDLKCEICTETFQLMGALKQQPYVFFLAENVS